MTGDWREKLQEGAESTEGTKGYQISSYNVQQTAHAAHTSITGR
jgi:hypothetical protein